MSKKRLLQLTMTLAVSACFLPTTHAADHDNNVMPMLSLLLFSGTEYKEVTSNTGQIWLDRNLGASQVATSPTDSSAYGNLYQWGRLTDGHEKRSSSTTPTLSSFDIPGHSNFITISDPPVDWKIVQNNTLWQGVSGINNPCPSGFRLPTNIELIEERDSWISQDSAGAFASPLKLVMAGARNSTQGDLNNVDKLGIYWSSTTSTTNAIAMFFGDSTAGGYSGFRANGYSVRCIKD